LSCAAAGVCRELRSPRVGMSRQLHSHLPCDVSLLGFWGNILGVGLRIFDHQGMENQPFFCHD